MPKPIRIALILAVHATLGCANSNEVGAVSEAIHESGSDGGRVGMVPLDLGEELPRSFQRPADFSPRESTCSAHISRNGPLSEEDVRSCMQDNNSAIQEIYQRQLRKNPALRGRVVFIMKISPTGEVVATELDKSTDFPIEVASQILGGIRKIRFPPSSSGWEDKYTMNFFTN